MRIATLFTCALMLAGCEHMYGGFDGKLSDSEAISLARREAARRGVLLAGRQPVVRRSETGAMVYFEDPACRTACLDGLPVVVGISPDKRRVIYFSDGRV
ncbi:MAG: hypothetical protein A2790_13275 [Phenylobacterium sp. RIFCSPHIGHO2_01_FULL_69_31]|jgi:hypothetical protein|uniref:hypothetical protein n=1 Tax=Phenylobacterium sp. RIFCSPHIGHO2_01_FULL_69_31 TaxID=1801944 RepID=UPI0008AB0B6D|nr:hypothetical protein [Phenylobacterium sp. RIFCSPHIGHO2_01_FULL_69_31]OHB29339.1 MAG: hypothetical protein A2790_13275 [Phenylobacterium sp. RIFCSPHIGHO2_01_FULL_69_31]